MQIEHSSEFVKARQQRRVVVTGNAKSTFTSPTNHSRMKSKINECPTTLSQTVFTQRNFVADFLQAKCDFRRKSAVLRF